MSRRFHINSLKILLFVILSGTTLGGLAQGIGSMMLLKDNFYAQLFNPALFRDDSAIELAIPGFAGVTIGNTASFRLSDLIRQQNGGGMVVDIEHFLSRNQKDPRISDWAEIPYFYFGIPVRNSRLNFSIKENIHATGKLTTEVVNFLVEGNDDGSFQSYNTDDMHVNAVGFREFSVGYSTSYNKSIKVGMRARLLFGSVSVKLRDWSYGIETVESGEKVVLSSKGEGFLSLPYPPNIKDNKLYGFQTDRLIERYLKSFGNPGFALDMGLSYQEEGPHRIDVSIRDLGDIWFRENSYQMDQDESFEFVGFDLSNSLNGTDGAYIDPRDLVQYTKDSVRNVIRSGIEPSRFFRVLAPKLLLHYSYTWNEKFAAGITNQSVFYLENMINALSASASQRFGRLTLMENLTMYGTDHVVMGAGMQWENRIAQFSIATDNILALYHPAGQKSFALTAGVCFLINKPKAEKDRKGSFSGELPFYEKRRK